MDQISYWVPLISAIAGGALVGLFNFVKDWQNRKSEERKHLNQIMLNAAIENWKQACNFAVEMSKIGQRSASILPLEAHIIYVMKLTDVLFNYKITKENVQQKLKEVREVCNEVEKFIDSSEKSEKT